MTAHGYGGGLYILQTVSGIKTGSGRSEALTIVQTVSGSGTSPYMYGAHIHWHNTGNPTIGHLAGLQIDMDNPGSACDAFTVLDLYRDGANVGSGRDCYIRCATGGSATPTSIIMLEANHSASAGTNFIEQRANVTGPVAAAVDTSTATWTYKIRCKIGSTTFYLVGVSGA